MMQQIGLLLDAWILPEQRMPAPGQKVLAYLRNDDGSLLGPTVVRPLQPDGAPLMYQGRPALKPLACWCPILPPPPSLQQENSHGCRR